MLRFCSNGVHFQTHFSQFLKQLLQYSTSSSAIRRPPSSMVDFMVKSLGFSRKEAKTIWSKVSSLELINFKQNPNLVVDFLKQRGLNKTQIKKLVSCRPKLLKCNVDRTLVPKFHALEEMGIFGSDIVEILASNASIIHRSLNTRIVPMIRYIKLNFGSDEKILKALRSARFMSVDVDTKLLPNIGLLRKYGLSDKRILNLITHYGQVFVHDPKQFEEIIVKVNTELQVPFDSATFPDAVVLIATFGDENREAKCKVFKRFGWTDMDILTMFRKLPRFLALSERSIHEWLEFFVNELGFEPGRLAESPYAMKFSMKGRVLPRYALLQGLKEREFTIAKVGILTAMCITEAVFLKKFVLPYKDEVPELCKAYICKLKNRESMLVRR